MIVWNERVWKVLKQIESLGKNSKWKGDTGKYRKEKRYIVSSSSSIFLRKRGRDQWLSFCRMSSRKILLLVPFDNIERLVLVMKMSNIYFLKLYMSSLVDSMLSIVSLYDWTDRTSSCLRFCRPLALDTIMQSARISSSLERWFGNVRLSIRLVSKYCLAEVE